MRRGELWRVSGLARDRFVVIVSADPINVGQQYPAVQGVPVMDDIATPAYLLVVSITTPMAGHALVPDVGPKMGSGRQVVRVEEAVHPARHQPGGAQPSKAVASRGSVLPRCA